MLTDRDAGFCSENSEACDDLHSRLEPRSPTEASEDSVEVKVNPIAFIRNKRKSTEPSRVVCNQDSTPLKKRIKYSSEESKIDIDNKCQFRPWDRSKIINNGLAMTNPAAVLVRHPGVTTLHRSDFTAGNFQDQPLALVAKKDKAITNDNCCDRMNMFCSYSSNKSSFIETNTTPSEPEISLTEHRNSSMVLESIPAAASISSRSSSSTCSQLPQQRNYKNMTRERRIEANARERTRVHTISAAYDTLRNAVPSYSNTQKLSKLSVLRVACSYILTLSRMAGYDYSEDQSSPSLTDCFDMVTRTIQTEGKIRKKKDE